MKKIILIPLFIAATLQFGCSTPPQSSPPPVTAESSSPPKTVSTALEGSWKGQDVSAGQDAPVSLIIAGQTLDFHGAGGPDDWVKGTFTLREDSNPKQFIGTVTDCASPRNVGKKAYAIYKIEDGTLTISGSQLGDPTFPAAFDATGSRELVFKRTQ